MIYTIRKIEAKDNAAMAQIIRKIFDELNAPKEGTAYADPFLDRLSEVYLNQNEKYFVVEINGEIKGGAGIAPLANDDSGICELQKMYFAPEIRGFGIAQEVMRHCLEFAKQAGFKKCYLETLPYMEAAQKLYRKFDFEYIDAPIGDTGHSSCHVFMLRDLE
ncbi:GNAT family N-acetyltransferase [Flavobacterium urocaniciphilum]|uniref:Putative acetyltransferase n=1 Tax=Flavobacterium urocaniciphilum TaxID=1299341 RepID=A0A1H8YSK4_9FLAO|nr:GNAT family N-acetyltransferase [Flavobacterium urocaniciphilum]SEP55001.1 putative acetyltransferase [Flavobacterium urocaniciphilum]